LSVPTDHIIDLPNDETQILTTTGKSMKTRSKEKLPDLFDASSTGPLEVLRRDRAVTETEATLIETRSTVGKDDVRRTISKVTVKVFARHSAGCPHRDDIYWRDCHGRIGIFNSHDGHDPRISAKPRTWSKAEKKRQENEDSLDPVRSEERRVGKECRYRWSPYH